MRSLQERIIWLAGFIDGEGTITVFNHTDRSQKWGFKRYTAIVCVVNTNEVLINEVQKILIELNISSHIFVRTPQKKQHKPAFQLGVRKITHIKRLLTQLIPYLVGKKAQAELTLRFVESRILRMGTGVNQYSPYNEDEMTISANLYELNKTGCHESSETIRQTP